ncbi:multidrug effflux MFS transporter [uncultured Martelella sp.]|uniref:multidrug effflux MFS transporter n=1 Tax=uncultured Martelella sp. TaxID=392331 RepID=UPI0029C61B3C|nr:multidrug effflux MFS transporter [uncultured Martelella sp.]
MSGNTALSTTPMSESRTSLIGAMMTMLGPFSLSIYTPAMPALAIAFNTTDAAIKLSLSVFFGGFAFAMLVAGPLADAFGRRKTAIGFLGIYMAGSLLAVFAGDVNALLLGRLVQGIGASAGLTVGRAIVRDQFTGEPAARIMNMIGIVLAVGPAVAPTVGGVILAVFDWKAIFLTMAGFGATIAVILVTMMAETIVPDRRKASPLPLLTAYWQLVTSARFMAASLLIASSVGTLYALASILPFVLIKVAGLTPSQYGVGMLMQTGLYFSGSVVFRFALGRFSSRSLVRIGLLFIALGAAATAVSVEFLPISYLSVMLPVGSFAFGIAFVMPYTMNAALLPFPAIAGSASALMGFMQMGSGLLTGIIAAAIGSPVLALQFIVPSMGAIAVCCYFWLRTVEKPELDTGHEQVGEASVPSDPVA